MAIRTRQLRIPYLPLAFLTLGAASLFALPGGEQVLDSSFHHLGDDSTPEWPEAPAAPSGGKLEIRFQSKANATENTLSITQRHVDNVWQLAINGKAIGELVKHEAIETHLYPIPAKTLVNGENVLTLTGETPTDDITVGDFRLIYQSFREMYDLHPVEVMVTDADTGAGLPARVTVTNEKGTPVELYYAATATTAVRPGIAYTADGRLTFEVKPGQYKVHATRGTEWSLGQADLTVASEGSPFIKFDLRREVDTRGWLAADTHIHTLTHSGHGDSSVEERVVTLAGEGVEIAIATDHNHHTDYRPVQRELGLERYYTSVTGNEVTTDNGHFNAFPLDPAGEVPDWKVSDWTQLVQGIREKGAQVVILNHPRWPNETDNPLTRHRYDPFTGRRGNGMGFTFDAMELVNSTCDTPDPVALLRDWFGLLNHGERVTAVGSSDSHTVGDPVGQGRTYVASRTDDPAQANVDEICQAFLIGRTSVSLGIFADIEVNGKHGMGSTVSDIGDEVTVDVRVASASWIRPERVRLFQNGIEVASGRVTTTRGQATETTVSLTLPKPPNDAYLVAVVDGPGVAGAHWKTFNDYTLAITNPVWLDVDGGGYRSPNGIARDILAHTGSELKLVAQALTQCDDAVAIQLLDMAREAYYSELLDRTRRNGAAQRDALREYLEQL